jgi:dihydrofolate reductase
VAAAENDVIGRGGGLPWHLPEDLKRFRRLTAGHAVVAGRKTHDSIVERLGHPLPDRTSIVVTRKQLPDGDGVLYRPDVTSALTEAGASAAGAGQDEFFIIGGADVYAQALPVVTRVYLTRVHRTVEGDAAMPDGWLDPFDLVEREDSTTGGFTFCRYERR